MKILVMAALYILSIFIACATWGHLVVAQKLSDCLNTASTIQSGHTERDRQLLETFCLVVIGDND